jgi:glycosyltransferase involved in cell wall biosynthesis
MKLKIAIVVHGRFFAFDLARELINQGQDVTLFTNYPPHIVEKFGIPKEYVKSFLLHGVLSRVVHKLHGVLGTPDLEAFLHSLFSKWAAKHLQNSDYDVVHAFSGIGEEIFLALANKPILKTLVRASADIRTQYELLSEEEKRAGVTVNKPSDWIIAREEREYQLADYVFVLSSFSKQSFIERNFDPNKLPVLPLGAQLEKFRPSQEVIEERCQRILNNEKLNVLMVGNFSYQKGAIDFVKISDLCSEKFNFRFVGTVTNEANELADKNSEIIDFVPKQPQFELYKYYNWADIFIFTTVQDGYPVVLSQAQAGGLPIITTTNCSGPDIIVEGKTGWVVPIRKPEKFTERLLWCDEHRQELVEMVWKVYQDFQPRDWKDVATDFSCICTNLLQQK